MAALTRTASASTRATTRLTRRTRLVTGPADSPSTAGKINASTAAHDCALASASSVAMTVARQQSRSPALIAANVTGSREASTAAVSTLRPAATAPIASIGPKQSAANSPTCPSGCSTSTQAPEASRWVTRAAYWATRRICTAHAALITCWAPSTCAARSAPAKAPALAWASANASRINVRACENLSNMCSSIAT